MLPQQEIPQAHSPPHILVSYANGIIRSASSRNTPQAHIRTLCKTFSSTLTAAQPLQPAHSRTQIQYDVSHLTAPSDTPRTPPSVSSKVFPCHPQPRRHSRSQAALLGPEALSLARHSFSVLHGFSCSLRSPRSLLFSFQRLITANDKQRTEKNEAISI